jgi:hypothetical protein
MMLRGRWGIGGCTPSANRGNMESRTSYYEILGVSKNASTEEIKTAFHDLAKRWHPDVNNNTDESNARFATLLNAYSNLISMKKRERYDHYMKTGKSINKRKSGTNIAAARNRSLLVDSMNMIMWDIEDEVGGKEPVGEKRKALLEVLSFIDKWVLEPNGFPDHFMDARKLAHNTPDDTYDHLLKNGNKAYGPYVSVNDYCMDVRKRLNGLMPRIATMDLLGKIAGTEIRKIDAILETQNMAHHYLGEIARIGDSDTVNVADYEHGDAIFRRKAGVRQSLRPQEEGMP